MTLPTYINANNPPSGNGVPSGIIKSIRDVVGDSNIASYVVPTQNRPDTHDITTLVKWNGQWSSDDYADAYFQLEFKDRYVYPTYYSLKGVKDWRYAKEWYLLGFNDEQGPMTVVSENTSVGSTFCSGSEKCASDDWGTFQIINKVEAFRYFRLTIKTPSHSTPANALRAFEIFGVYSSNKAVLKTKKAYCFASYPIKSHLPAYVLFRLLTTYIVS